MRDFVITRDLYYNGDLYDDNEMYSFVVFDNPVDFVSYEEVVKHDKWREVVDTEMLAIKKNKRSKLENLPRDAKKIGVKWVYKTKYNEE